MLKVSGNIICCVFFDFGVFLIHMMAVQHTSLTVMDCSLRGSSALAILHIHGERVCFSGSPTLKKQQVLKNSETLTCMREKLQNLGENCIASSGRDLFMLGATISSGKRERLLS